MVLEIMLVGCQSIVLARELAAPAGAAPLARMTGRDASVWASQKREVKRGATGDFVGYYSERIVARAV